ncbi:DUF6286 domain-containing protein [Streptomyces sp. NPDC049577]|uniref:DUF6286 domain-containing protein n=1 Tax=Streptomyces sp. NPDC049577 TaxID=3155153 RepID=UPI00341D567A
MTAPDDTVSGDGRAHRFWSARRLPAALVALAVLGAAGILLYDVVAVRAHHPAMAWRRRLAGELAHRHLGNGWVIGCAATAVLAGCWLIALAVTPGLRGLLPMRREAREIRAALERKAAAQALRDRALKVPGVRAVRVDVGRRRVRARAQSHFRELDEVRADVDAALAEGVRELGLARRPLLSVRVRRPAKR